MKEIQGFVATSETERQYEHIMTKSLVVAKSLCDCCVGQFFPMEE